MKRGLVIGKFMPLHLGHIALIEFAMERCDEVIVSMSFKPDDPIDGPLRFSWIVETFRDHPKIRPELTVDNFDDESLPMAERTKIWASYIKRRMPPLDLVVSSEEYGAHFAEHLGIPHVSFDPPRTAVPVSATLIRQKPFKHWAFIPRAVRPFFVKKICFFGPESTGKSTLARELAKHYRTEFVPEVARELIDSNDFSEQDIIRIGEGQTSRVLEKQKSANKFLFCDTDVITTEIYSQHYLETVPPVLFDLEKQVTYDYYFLMDIDIPWVSDGLRDLGHRRKEMYDIFKGELEKRNIPYIVAGGTMEYRLKIIQRHLDWLLAKS